ncbi:hypothetical protein J6590_081762 [Homalodisca vitripennis]|nr:hypothetical protein J6590_081762 [Homalodisca vitripennis]
MEFCDNVRQLLQAYFRDFADAQPMIVHVASNPLIQGDFHMEFCDNVRQLLQAYFSDFADAQPMIVHGMFQLVCQSGFQPPDTRRLPHGVL